MRSFILIVIVSLLLSGCGLGVLAGGIGYAVSSSKSADAEQTRSDAIMAEKYTQYRIDMEKINFEREKAKLKPMPIMEISEWKTTMGIYSAPVSSPQPAPEPPKKTTEESKE